MKSSSLSMVDVCGAVATLALVGMALWSGLVHAPQSAKRAEELAGALADADLSLRRNVLALQRQRVDVAELQNDIAARGALPSSSPVETDLRTVAELARDHRLELVRVSPLASKRYPGLAEIKYAVEARGDFGGVLGFLRAFQASGFWADITDLSIGDQRARNPNGGEGARSARFVISLFATEEGAPS